MLPDRITIEWRVRSQHPALPSRDLRWTRFERAMPLAAATARLTELAADPVFEYRLKVAATRRRTRC